MKNPGLATLLVLATLSVAVTQAMQAAQSRARSITVEGQIQQLENELTQAAIKGDTSVLERLLAIDYTNTAMASGTRTRAQVIADVKSGAAKNDSITLEDVNVRVYDNVAILTARQTSKSQFKGRDTSGTYYRLRVYAKRLGQWRAVALQTTPVA
jgi:hypothetical protein